MQADKGSQLARLVPQWASQEGSVLIISYGIFTDAVLGKASKAAKQQTQQQQQQAQQPLAQQQQQQDDDEEAGDDEAMGQDDEAEAAEVG